MNVRHKIVCRSVDIYECAIESTESMYVYTYIRMYYVLINLILYSSVGLLRLEDYMELFAPTVFFFQYR